MSNSMNAKLERRDDGKKPSNKTLSFRSANTGNDGVTLKEIAEFLQTGPEPICVLPVRDMRIDRGGSASGLLAVHGTIVTLHSISVSGSREISVD
jgi:hypothetical protein